MVELIGFITIGLVVFLLITGKANPVVILAGIPVLAAFFFRI